VEQSHEISRAALGNASACLRLTQLSGIMLCCTAWKQAIVYHYSLLLHGFAAHAAFDFPLLWYTSVSCGHACITNEREHTRTEHCI
jgi:hypothetical protein